MDPARHLGMTLVRLPLGVHYPRCPLVPPGSSGGGGLLVQRRRAGRRPGARPLAVAGWRQGSRQMWFLQGWRQGSRQMWLPRALQSLLPVTPPVSFPDETPSPFSRAVVLG